MGLTVIGGKFKGCRLYSSPKHASPTSPAPRPLLARIKKSLFDIISSKIPNATFLDLFAGTGSVGIEALSRGAKFAVFVDSDYKCVETINRNIGKLNLQQKSKVYRKDIMLGLEFLNISGYDKFDIVFIGPPYKDFLISKTLVLISAADILKNTAIIIAQHHKKEEIHTKEFEIFRQEKYGDTVLSFLKKSKLDSESERSRLC